jgi:protein TonB
MKPELAASFIAAILFHALVLFGFRMETSARPLAMSDEPSPLDVSLVEEAPAPAPPQPAATPEPSEPQPTPDMSTPPPEPEPTPEEETLPAPESPPAPEPPKTAPHHSEERHTRTAAPHSAPGAATAVAGAASHGAVGRSAIGTRARYLSNPKPEYPEAAKEMRQQGVVVVSVEVGTDGHANDVSVSQSSGFSQLDEAAVRAVRRWLFEPARTAGLPVSSHVEVPVRFSLSE